MPQNTSININSKYFIDRLENDIVQLAKTMTVEYSVDIEEAKLMARKVMQTRLNGLLTKEEKEGIELIKQKTKEYIKNTHEAETLNYSKDVYELLKTFDLI